MLIILELLLCYLTVFSTIQLSIKFNFSQVLASGLITLILLVIINLVIPKEIIANRKLDALIFGASFVGMCSKNILKKQIEIAICSALFLLLFIIISPLLPKIGGALGLIAFISVCSVKALKRLTTLVDQMRIK